MINLKEKHSSSLMIAQKQTWLTPKISLISVGISEGKGDGNRNKELNTGPGEGGGDSSH